MERNAASYDGSSLQISSRLKKNNSYLCDDSLLNNNNLTGTANKTLSSRLVNEFILQPTEFT